MANVLNKCAADLRDLVLELGKMAPATKHAARYFRACQGIGVVADLLEGKVEVTPEPEPKPKPPSRRQRVAEEFRAGIIHTNGRVIHAETRFRRSAESKR